MFQTANSAVEIIQILVGVLRAVANVGYNLLDDIGSIKTSRISIPPSR